MFKSRSPNSKIRFQNVVFKKRLNQARGYKRAVRRLPDKDWEIWLSKIGLGSIKIRVTVLAVLFALVYLVYIPNFFFIKHIQINGVKPQDAQQISTDISFFFKSGHFWPQKNLLLLSAEDLKKYLTGADKTILAVDKITKKFPNSLTIDIRPRFDKFLIQMKDGSQFIASNDGVILRQIPPSEIASSSPVASQIVIKFSQAQAPGQNQFYLSQNLVNLINQLSLRLPGIINNAVTGFEMTTPDDSDLTVTTDGGYRLLFDVKAPPDDTLGHLSLLINNLPAGNIKNLSYVDMRFQNKSYVCEKKSPCDGPAVLPQATTTPNINF